jgi:Cysteine-rich CWC
MEPQVDQVPSRELLCARCGTAFQCGLGGDCWCAAEPVRAPMPAPGSGEDCLCPACLRAAAAGAARHAD